MTGSLVRVDHCHGKVGEWSKNMLVQGKQVLFFGVDCFNCYDCARQMLQNPLFILSYFFIKYVHSCTFFCEKHQLSYLVLVHVQQAGSY